MMTVDLNTADAPGRNCADDKNFHGGKPCFIASAVVCSRARNRTRHKESKRRKGITHGNRIFHDAVASAGVRIERGTRVGPRGAQVARSTRLSGGMDRRASYGAMGAASGSGPSA